MPQPFLRFAQLFFVILIMLSTASRVPAVEVGSVAPDFELRTLDGKIARLSDYRGGPVILKLATTWCPSCREQVEAIDSLAPFLVEHEVMLLEVFVGEREEVVRKALAEREILFRHEALLDPSGAVFNGLYQGYVIPRVLLLDEDLRVRHDGTLIGAELLERRLNDFVAE